MLIPEDLKYSEEHEWVKVNGNMATIGITDYAQDQLGEIVYVELPAEGERFSKADAFGSVESVKSVNDIFSPLTGRVAEINDPLVDSPETINEEPYGEGWMIKIEMANKKELEDLMSADEYEVYISEETK
ncbi:MAG: glycine cleavage system protein H [Deltaproteobacteria bacterium RIFCSPLOWO2_02_FULL_50_16]|nr:MAG: glycine cleavage system protein H [Deltaproteobacteria bacterium RIFCSPHIGHO2_02_FULL_50_15]OGQ56306.1 MAG: glycine cleavage system protein H [Deltaproteobacteria bacterium RIFCSPLOWO2_02_FULL_50_16]OGQ65780.1 MAG: glycine cleavage system protein H [Deltaproteobacteria bacterium RIFCSPLOWO2_12_FULL_50_11]